MNGDEDKKKKNKDLWNTVYQTLAATTSMQIQPNSASFPMHLVPVAFEGFLDSSVWRIMGTADTYICGQKAQGSQKQEGCLWPMGNNKFSLPESQIPYSITCM